MADATSNIIFNTETATLTATSWAPLANYAMADYRFTEALYDRYLKLIRPAIKVKPTVVIINE